ncbi:MAG: uracil-DNA glycosylase [Candidatus Marithrix sp.]
MQDLKFTDLVKLNVPVGWEEVFEDSQHEFKDLGTVLDDQEQKFGKWFPNKSELFTAFHHTPLDKVKVVIIGQDPYHQQLSDGEPRATGMSFSVREYDDIPVSLKNIYKVLHKTISDFQIPDHGDLSGWAKQGVLMLNTCLTVKPGSAGSHKQIWMGFIKKVITAISVNNSKCIYLLWGREAQKLKSMIGEKAVILETSHPSGFSAYQGFISCDHFNEVNEILTEQSKDPINWQIKSREELFKDNSPVLINANCDVEYNESILSYSDDYIPKINSIIK